MSFLTAVSGFMVLLLSVSVVLALNDWSVTYSPFPRHICAKKGSTVEISGTYTYPARIDGKENKPLERFWFTRKKLEEYNDVEKSLNYSGRVNNTCAGNKCTLRITKLSETDSAEYRFRFITNLNRYFGHPGVTLNVTDLQVEVSRSHGRLFFRCFSSCPAGTPYIWFKNGQKIKDKKSQIYYPGQVLHTDRYSCAVGRYEEFPSPLVYAPKLPSVSVSPSGEIVEGSSVTLSCSSDANPATNYTWYKEDESKPKESGEIFTISAFRGEHSGNYSCEAQNMLGRQKSTSRLIVVAVVQGQFDWEVTYSSHQICAFKGSTVDIPCTYTYPSSWNEHDVVFKPFWFRGMNGNNPVDLSSDPDYSGRVEYLFEQNDCTLRIKDLRERDSAEYKFTLRTNKPDQSWTEPPGVSLSITDPDLHVMVNSLPDDQGQTRAELKCHSCCHLPAHRSYIWYRNGRTTSPRTSSFSGEVYPADSFACALKGHEGFPSPAVCVQGENCNRVTYADRGICAIQGSSVDISCTYNSYGSIKSKFWFSPERSQQWRFPIRPEDLREDPQFSGRVQVIETERGNSTLRIVDLRLSDSAQYHFKFKTKSVEWISGLPATTLTLTDLQVLVNITSVNWSSGSAELRCHSSCSPAGQPSYIWFKSGEKIQTETSSFTTHLDSSDSFACALKRYEDFPSAPVCVYGRSCNTVVYEKRRICALKGSIVDITCIYFSFLDLSSSLWFSPARSPHWQDQTQPEDLREDSKYTHRVWVFATERGRSTLRISDLRESDSAEYRFRFSSGRSGWGGGFPGSTLTVTALQVQVTAVTVHQDYTEAALRCHNSCSPAGRVSYVWFKNRQRILDEDDSSLEDHFYPGDSISCAVRGLEESSSPSVYALKAPSVSVSPPGDLTEGLSVSLTCSTDAIIAAKFTWYKRNQTLLREDPQLVFSSIQSSDSGEYYCTAENQLGKKRSEPVFIDVKYPPKPPSVSVSPSGEVLEGTSVNLSCSSDANPAANYTWYKEDEDSPKASCPDFVITESRPEHSGNYYCEARNGIGRTNGSLGLLVVEGAWRSPAAGTALGAVLAVLLLVVFILMRKKTASQRSHETGERADENQEQFQTTQSTQEEQATLHYASVRFTTHPTDALYSNIRPAQRHSQEPEEDEGVEYAAITFHNGSSAPRGAASLRRTSS